MANGNYNIGYLLLFSILSGIILCFEENCDYLDKSRKDRTNHLQCNYGCCGDFKHRDCCPGPIAIVGGIFGSLVLIFVIAVVVGVCYTKFNGKNAVKPIPTITAGMYNGIPEPTPPLPSRQTYNSQRLRPPPIITKSKLLMKTPTPPTATDLTSMNSSSSGSTSAKESIPKISDTTYNPRTFRNTVHTSLNVATTRFQDIPNVVKERVFREHHPPPSEMHPPRFTPVRK